jgi:ribosomal protein L40E
MEYFVLTIVGCVLGWLWWRGGVRERELRREEEEREGLRRRIELDPDNVAAYERLGDNLRRAGRLREAAQVYTDALARVDETDAVEADAASARIVFQLQYKLRHIDEYIRAGESKRNPIQDLLTAHRKPQEIVFCRHCGASNAPEAERCELCGEFLPIETFAKSVSLTLGDRVSRRALIDGLVIIAVVILVLRICAGLSAEIRGTLTISACLVAAFRLMWPAQR